MAKKARRGILRFKSWVWSSVLGVMGLCVAGCPCEPPVVEYGPAPLYGIIVEKAMLLAQTNAVDAPAPEDLPSVKL